MTLLSRIVGILGVVLIIAALVMLFSNVIAINQLFAVASALRNSTTPNPAGGVMLTVGLSAIGGLLAGVGGASVVRRRGH
jgi:hypothetical protein